MAAPRHRMSAPARALRPGPMVAFMGEPGAFADEAIDQVWRERPDRIGVATFADVVDAVARARATHGVLPIENNRAGLVSEAIESLMDGRVVIVAQTVVAVRHCLAAPPGASLRGLRRVFSHPMAIAQCSELLASRPALAAVPEASTSGAARAVAGRGDAEEAVLASRGAAERYGLHVLADDVQDDPANATRFWVVVAPGPDRWPVSDAAVAGTRHVLLHTAGDGAIGGGGPRPGMGTGLRVLGHGPARSGGARRLLELAGSSRPDDQPTLPEGPDWAGVTRIGGYSLYRSNELAPGGRQSSGRLLAVRGATTVQADEPESIGRATHELLDALLVRNGVRIEQVISAFFTATPDLAAAFPATAARVNGWSAVPMMCASEMAVPGALQRCIRVLLHLEGGPAGGPARHVYLRDASALRPDLADAAPS